MLGTNFGSDARSLYFFIETNNDAGFSQARTVPVTDDQFHHVAAVVDRTSNTVAIYLDGVLQQTAGTANVGNISNSGRFFIGHNSLDIVGSTGVPFDGVVDELDVINRALSQAEIQGIFGAGSAGKCRNQPPVLAAIGNRTVAEEATLSFQVTATDPDPGDTLTYAASNLPPGATFTPGNRTFTWTPGFTQAGTYPGAVFTVSDGVETDSETITITVTNSNRPPVLAAVGNRTTGERQVRPSRSAPRTPMVTPSPSRRPPSPRARRSSPRPSPGGRPTHSPARIRA